MSALSNIIEEFIKNLISDAEDGTVEIQRNELAQYFNCAPSQINYVLTTRFTSYKGYYVESRRGGGGYIKIVKVNLNDGEYIKDEVFKCIGDSISKAKAYSIIEGFLDENIVTEREANLMKIALSDRSLSGEVADRGKIRASILKNMILALVKE